MYFFDAEMREVGFWLALEECVQDWLHAEQEAAGTPPEAESGAAGAGAAAGVAKASAPGAVFLWQPTVPTIVFGKHQVPEAEFDVERAQAEGVAIVRRPSGGGAIYADGGTFFYSIILPFTAGTSPQVAMRRAAEPLVQALQALGVAAELKGSNDIEVNGAKISGFAQFVRKGMLCAHCTLLYDTDLGTLGTLLRPDREKYTSKALKSVRSRVTNIAEVLRAKVSTQQSEAPTQLPVPSTSEFRAQLRAELFRILPDLVERPLTVSEQEAVSARKKARFDDPAWVWGSTPPFSYRNRQRFAGGSLEVLADVAKGKLCSLKLRGDFLGVLPLEELEARFEGCAFTREDIAQALVGVDLALYLGSIDAEELLGLLFGSVDS
jgi:lipoate-protein ligase A